MLNNPGKALISLGGCLIAPLNLVKLRRGFNFLLKGEVGQTDMGREGPVSKGEQPRPLAKVLKV
jgi:hypothetical protein